MALVEWQRREAVVREISDCYTEAEGRISSIEVKEEKRRIVLKNCRVWKLKKGRREKEGFSVPCILVTIKASEEGKALKIGQTLCVKGEAAAFPEARNPGEFDSQAYYHSLGLDCRFYGEEFSVTEYGSSPALEAIRQMKNYAKESLYRFAEERDAGVFSAAVLGDKEGLPKDLKLLFQKSGISHLLAISGLHLSFLGLLLYRLLRKCGLLFGWAGILALMALLCYGVLTGGSPSVFRAGVMMAAGFLASYVGRTYDLLSAASLSLILLSLHSPLLLTQGGVQLSFGAVFAIGGVSPVVEQWIGRKEPFFKTISASAAIQLVTMPMIAYHFYQLPLYGIFLNFLVIPLMGGVLISSLSIILLGNIWSLLGIWAAGAGHYILLFYEMLCNGFSKLPFYSLTVGKPDNQRLCAYIFFSVLWILVMKQTFVAEEKSEKEKGRENGKGEDKDKKRDGLKSKGTSVLKFLILAAAQSFFLFILFPGNVAGLNVRFLDVGQGDGILLQTGKTAILIDGGSSSNKFLGEYTLEPTLKSLGISRIDYAFISHGDLDHYSGVKYLLQESEDIAIDCLVLPCLGREEDSVRELKALGTRRGARIHFMKAGETLFKDGLKLQCLYPEGSDRAEDANGQSLVVKADYGSIHILFTGDMGEREEEILVNRYGRDGILADINVLKAGHHGSKYSSSENFLRTVSPRWAVISYGEGNSYGHPHEEAVSRLEKENVTIFETARMGAVWLKTDGRLISFSGFVDAEELTRYNRKQ